MAIIKDIFTEVLQDSLLIWPVNDFVPRALECPWVPGKATVITGVRRAGKSTFMRQTALAWIERGICGKEQVIFLNFSDERLFGLKANDLGAIIEAHYQLNPRLPHNSGLLFFLDEIQLIEGWELFVDRLVRNKQNRVVLSGSSAKLLSLEIATELRGRAINFEVFPFSLREAAQSHNYDPSGVSAADRGKLAYFVDQYLYRGGFPEIQNLTAPLQRQVIQEYLQVLLLRDVIERHQAKDSYGLQCFLNTAFSSIAAPCTFTKTAARLRSLGCSATAKDAGEYFAWFEDCYLFWLVPVLAESKSRQNTNPRKLYCVDNGLINATMTGLSSRQGTLLENLVFIALRRKARDIFYYKTSSGHEVDFVVKDNSNNEWSLFQVCAKLEGEKTRERELSALCECASELGLKSGRIITLHEEAEINWQGITVFVESLGKFLL